MAGCPLVGLLSMLLADAPPYRIVGTDGDRLLFVEQAGVDELQAMADGEPPEARDLRAVDVGTLAAETVLPDVVAFGQDIAANGDWLAWIDWAGEVVRVRALGTGAESSYYEGQVAFDDEWALYKIADDRLIIQRLTGITIEDRQYEFIVLDLLTGEDKHVAGCWGYGTFAIDGDYLAFMTNEATDVEVLGLELATNIDLVNLATDERQTVAPDLRVSGDGYAIDLLIDGGRVIWQQFKPGGFQSQINSYDIAAGTTSTLADNINPSNGDRWLHDVSGERLLLELRTGNALVNEVVSLELRTVGGDTVTIVEFPGSFEQRPSYDPEPRFIGDFVVWTDPYSGEFVVYDPATGTTQRYDPGA
jgi:hypothetical protein